MKCSECQGQAKRSKVYPKDLSDADRMMEIKTAEGEYWDEEGNHHVHESPVSLKGYRCSEGHTFKEVSEGNCWCGWPFLPAIPN